MCIRVLTGSCFTSERQGESWHGGSGFSQNLIRKNTLEELKIEIRDKENQGRGQCWSEAWLTWGDALAHDVENKGWRKDRERMTGVKLCSLWLSHSPAEMLRHRQRLCTHNSVWFRAAIERIRIISSIICRKVWPDWIRRIVVCSSASLSFCSSNQSLFSAPLLHSMPSSQSHFHTSVLSSQYILT